MIKRILILSFCIIALVVVMVVPAIAAPLDYNDYITNITVDGDNDIVTVTIPASFSNFEVYTGGVKYTTVGSGIDIPVIAEQSVSAYINHIPQGFSVDNIPSGTLVNISFFCGFDSSFDTPNVLSRYWYCNSSGSQVTDSVVTNFGKDGFSGRVNYSFTINKPSGASSVSVRSDVTGLYPFYSGTFELYCYDTILTMSISSLYRLQQESGKTNEILTEVEKQLADQGKTLDDVLGEQQETNDKLDEIINGTVDPSAPAGSGSVGDLDDAEAGLREDSQAGLDQGLAMQQSALGVFLQYASAFAAAGAVFEIFANIPFFSFLLYVSVALGVFGLLLNLGVDTSLAASDAARRDRMATNRRIIRQSRRN